VEVCRAAAMGLVCRYTPFMYLESTLGNGISKSCYDCTFVL
jgi:hypothetical protein